jgi:ATP-binding cassette subfamily B protein
MEAAPSAERFFELMDAAPDVADVPGALRLQGVREGIRISDVSFSYGREPVLQNVSLEVSAGEVVAIVGPTGAGKTTLADLLPRFYDPDSGSIEIDGIDLRRIERASLLSHIAVVTQEPFLFAGSIWDNLRYGRPDASRAEIEAAARAAHVDEFIGALPRGYDTDVGDAGVMLSGGQRQRITIGRAILKNPAILIFDEATSSLDARSERYVHQAIESLLAGRTVFIIAHRLSTIRRADKIAVLMKGSVVALGTHEELMAEKGLYEELMSIQSEEREEAPL